MPINRWNALAVATIASIGLGGAGGAALASSAGTIELAQAQNFSDEKLQAFVAATEAVDAITQDYDRRISETESNESRTTLIREAQAEMATAVEDTQEISVEEYNAIYDAAGSDPELARRLNSMLQTGQR
jgi:succinylglutamate desuccinylase